MTHRTASAAIVALIFACLNACAPGALRKYQPAREELAQGLEISADSLRTLEQSPLTTAEMQTFYVGGAWYQRFLADSAFVTVSEYDYDNLRDFPLKTVFDVVLALPDSASYALARVQAGSLAPTKKAGFFRGYLPRKKLRMLILNGISAYATIPFKQQEN